MYISGKKIDPFKDTKSLSRYPSKNLGKLLQHALKIPANKFNFSKILR